MLHPSSTYTPWLGRRPSLSVVPGALLAAVLAVCIGQRALAEERSIDVPALDYVGFLQEPTGNDTLSDTAGAATDHAAAETTRDNDHVMPYLPPSCAELYRIRFPTSYAWVDALVLKRDNDAANRPLVADLNTDDVLLTVGDLDFDWSGGLRVGYACREANCWGVEFVYLGYFDQSASARVVSEDDLALPGDLGLQVNNFFAADDVRVHYTSDIDSAEANAVCCCVGCERSLEWLAGFRYVYVGEGLGITAMDSAESTTRYNVGTDNNLVGAQLGARAHRRVGCFAWEATGKAGIFANFMDQNQEPIIDFPDFRFRPGRGSERTDAAFVGDLNLTGIYQLTDVWGLRAGYNVIWIEGLALAPDQLDFSNNPGSGRDLVSGGSILLHGINVGVEARW